MGADDALGEEGHWVVLVVWTWSVCVCLGGFWGAMSGGMGVGWVGKSDGDRKVIQTGKGTEREGEEEDDEKDGMAWFP